MISFRSATHVIGLASVVLLASLGASACGSSPTSTAAETKPSECEQVVLGKDSGGITVYGEVVRPTGVDCATAQVVVREWGHQQLGVGYEANLPAGWKCDGSGPPPPCTKGSASVGLVLVYPAN